MICFKTTLGQWKSFYKNKKSYSLDLFQFTVSFENQTQTFINQNREIFPALQWCQIENQQSPVYVVNSHVSRHPDNVANAATT